MDISAPYLHLQDQNQITMKKIALIAALGLSLLLGFRSDARVNINVSFGMPVIQQPWYASDNEYVYMPDQGVYFNTRRQVYVFQDGGRWCTAQRLPARFGNFNYRSARTVRMHDFRPFERDFDNRRRFAMGQNGGFRGGDDRRDMNRFDDRDRNGRDGRVDNRGGFDNRDGRSNSGFDNRGGQGSGYNNRGGQGSGFDNRDGRNNNGFGNGRR
jgi:hypothetical protein